MDRLDLYRQLYFEELRRKEELRSALALPVGMLTVLGGVIAIYIRVLGRSSISDPWVVLLGIGTLLLMGTFLLTVTHLIKSYHDYTYSFVPYAPDLEEAFANLMEYHEAKGQARADFEAELIGSFSKAHKINAFNNDSKSGHLHNANQMLVYSIALVLVCSVPFFVRTNSTSPDVQKVEITNLPQRELGTAE